MAQILMSIASTELTAEEEELLDHQAVAGVVLFSENYDSVAQLRELTQAIRAVAPDSLVTVDQEGGRIQRFREDFIEMPAMRVWGETFQKAGAAGLLTLKQQFAAACQELRGVGVNCNLMPVLDVDYNSSQIIFDRSISPDPDVITAVGEELMDLLHAQQLPAIGKHFPGHGFVAGDSHKRLPVDIRSLDEMMPDLAVFRSLLPRMDAVMTAHVFYSSVGVLPATFSPYWIREVLRGQFGFDGVVMTDDLTMKGAVALGSVADRVLAAVDASCDLLLFCHSQSDVVTALTELEAYDTPDSDQRVRHFVQQCVSGSFTA